MLWFFTAVGFGALGALLGWILGYHAGFAEGVAREQKVSRTKN
jgi:hypothetical protein